MSDRSGASCALCLQRDETQRTGPLATKDEVTAHQNCLLFSSGLFSRHSPHLDDLFGFDVDDVLTEVKRGSKLICNKCKKKGATAGCEVKRCKKSYHYPCALQDGAHSVEDAAQGQFGLYCSNHYQQQTQSHDVAVKGRPAKRASEPGSSEVYCPACKKTEGHISVDSLSRSIVGSYCHKHAPATRRRIANGGSTSAMRPSACSSDSNSSSERKFRQLRDKQEAITSKRWNVISTDDSSNSDRSDSDMDIFAPLDTDFGESANSVPEARLTRRASESPTGSTPGNQVKGGRVDGNDEEVGGNDEEEEGSILPSDVESESLLLPVSRSPSARSAAPPLPRVVLMKSAEAMEAAARRSDQDLGFHSTRFWKSCNAAGCTRALFAGFINEMNAVASRIQSDRASQEDYDHALTVMTASGKLEALVAQQQEELQRKQAELLTATGAMKEVVAALKTRVHQQAP